MTKALKLVIYGDAGVGKSTLASHFPDVKLLDSESGLRFIDCDSIDISSSKDFVTAIKSIGNNKPRTLVLDTIDSMYDILISKICNDHEVEALGDIGYGKGWRLADLAIFKCLAALHNSTADDGYTVLCAHAAQKVIQKGGLQITRTQFAGEALLSRHVEKWADIIMYVESIKNGQAYKRVATLEPSRTLLAKCRVPNAPSRIPFTMEALTRLLSDKTLYAYSDES